jgi:hypothetical protein
MMYLAGIVYKNVIRVNFIELDTERSKFLYFIVRDKSALKEEEYA